MKNGSTSEAVDYFSVPRPVWRKVRRELPKEPKPKERAKGRPRIAHRNVLNGIWYILWTGCQWKAVNRDWFGVSASVLHDRFQEWESLGVFAKLMRAMVGYYAGKRGIKWKWQALDAKSCPSPLGGEATGKNPTDRGKRGSKIHLLVDHRGAPLALTLTGANRHDSTAALDLIAALVVCRPKSKQHLCADKAYDTLEIRDFLGFQDYTIHIKENPRRAGKKKDEAKLEPTPNHLESHYPARRWVIERTFAWLAKRRSLRTRWCKKQANWLALIQFACADILLNLSFSG
jgi:putative transposase